MKKTISITDIPEALSAMRLELARILRNAAADEAPTIARRLRQIAAAFEAGVTEV